MPTVTLLQPVFIAGTPYAAGASVTLALHEIAKYGPDTIEGYAELFADAAESPTFGVVTASKLVFSDTVWDDVRIVPTAFDFAGNADPVAVNLTIGTKTFRAFEFAKDDEAFAAVQMPHGYKRDGAMKVHIHWSPGTYGNEQRGNTVGWKVDYSLAAINQPFSNGAVAAISQAVPADCVDHQHLITSSAALTVPSGFGESGMVLLRVFRSDTGTDDTWTETATGRLPLLLELDIHYEADKVGSDNEIPT